MDQPEMVSLGQQLRARRLELGLQQLDAAELAGVSTRFVRAVEHDKPSVQLDKLRLLLDALGLELDIRVRRVQ